MAHVLNSSPFLKLPVELIDNIAAYLEKDNHNLSSYSLISKASLDIARRRLFRSIKLHVSYEQAGDRGVSKYSSKPDASNSCSSNARYLGDFLKFIQDDIPTAKYIRELNIRGRYACKQRAEITLVQLDLIMATCASLEFLSLKSVCLRIDPSKDAPAVSTILTPRPTFEWSIQTLELSLITAQSKEDGGPSGLFYILSSFRKIDSLTLALESVMGNQAVETVEDALPKDLEVRSLTLDGDIAEPSFYHALSRTTLARNLRELRIPHTFDNRNFSLVEEALIPSCSALDSFELDMRRNIMIIGG